MSEMYFVAVLALAVRLDSGALFQRFHLSPGQPNPIDVAPVYDLCIGMYTSETN